MNNEFESNGFVKFAKKNKKVCIHLYNKQASSTQTFEKIYSFNFETNIIQSIPETDIMFAIASETDNDSSISFFINKGFNFANQSCASPTRTFYPNLTDKYKLTRYIYEYANGEILKIDTDEEYYLKVSIITADDSTHTEKINQSNINQELLRFECATNGVSFILPPKRTFVFYNDRLEIYNKNKLIRTIKYDEIIEVQLMKTWQNNVFINCKPIGVMLYKVSNEICSKIKEITGK